MKKLFLVFCVLIGLGQQTTMAMNVMLKSLYLPEGAFGQKNGENYCVIDMNGVDSLVKKSLKDLASRKIEKGFPYFLALFKIEGEDSLKYCDANALIRWMFNGVTFERSQVKYVFGNKKIASSIYFYEMSTLEQKNFCYICSEDELRRDDEYGYFGRCVMKANLGDARAMFALGNWYKHANQIDDAKQFYDFAAQRDNGWAARELGLLYFGEGNTELAKKYLTIAVRRGCKDVEGLLKELE